MKNLLNVINKSKSITLAVFGLTTLFSTTVHSQFVPATNPDISVAGGVTCNSPSVSVDMLSNSTGIVKAISYYDGSNGYVFVEDDIAGSVLIPLSSGSAQADIVLADDINNLGTNYILAVVYDNGGRAYLETYELYGFGVPGGLNDSLIKTSLLGPSGGFPHIDMFADNSQLVNGLPSLHQYVVAWNEGVSGGSQINAQYGEIDNLGSILNSTVVNSVTSGALLADVAASNNVSTGDLTAYFSIQYNTIPATLNELRHSEWVCNSLSSPTTSTLMTSETYFPHIEAMGLYDPSVSNDPWVIAAPKINSASDIRLYMFNSSNLAGIDCSPTAPYYDITAAASAVAAGTGDPVGVGYYANDNYSVGWYASSYGYISKAIDYTTGSVSTVYPGNYQINLNAGPGCQKQSLAMSSTSNLGRGLLAAWYSGAGRVFYKLSADIATFRPAPLGIGDKALLNNTFTVSPNPSNSNIQVRGSREVTISRIEIYNLLGQLIYNENVDNKNVLDLSVAQLPSGIYNLTIYSNDSKTVKKIQVIK